MALEVTIPALLAGQGIGMYNKSQLHKTTPSTMPSSEAYSALDDAADKRIAKIAPNASDLVIARQEYVPGADDPFNSTKSASNTRATAPDGRAASVIRINPNVDRSYYAHELGHSISQKTNVGNFINNARGKLSSNPKMGKALAIALTGAVPGVAAALQEGDDDLAGSIALAAAIASPTLIDEALASKNALAIMQDAGMRATAGQRGRLAGAYLSYLAPVLIAGSVGNALGNVVDDHTALYDL